jgi:replicative DNA helicase
MIPPHNLDAERAILGACILEGRIVSTLIMPADFYSEANRTIMLALFGMRPTPIDALTLADYLRRHNQLDAVGGPAYLALLMEEASIAVHQQEYAKIVRRHSVQRSAIQMALDLQRIAAEDGPDFEKQLDNLIEALTNWCSYRLKETS